MVRGTAGSGLRRKKGAIVSLYTTPPVNSLVICLDEMGPERAKSFAGARLVRSDPAGPRRARAPQAIDDGRRGRGSIVGVFVPVPGAALTAPSARRTTANVVAVLDRVAAWLEPTVARVSAVLDHLRAHRAVEVLLWALAHPRWEFVFQPNYAASRNLSQPWWKVVHSRALTGRRFVTWADLCAAVDAATRYGNAHRHPFVWGKRQRRRLARASGVASHPVAA